jgi:hypothetical protein
VLEDVDETTAAFILADVFRFDTDAAVEAFTLACDLPWADIKATLETVLDKTLTVTTDCPSSSKNSDGNMSAALQSYL